METLPLTSSFSNLARAVPCARCNEIGGVGGQRAGVSEGLGPESRALGGFTGVCRENSSLCYSGILPGVILCTRKRPFLSGSANDPKEGGHVTQECPESAHGTPSMQHSQAPYLARGSVPGTRSLSPSINMSINL